MSLELVIISLLVECDSIAVLRRMFFSSLKIRLDCFIIFFYSAELILLFQTQNIHQDNLSNSPFAFLLSICCQAAVRT